MVAFPVDLRFVCSIRVLLSVFLRFMFGTVSTVDFPVHFFAPSIKQTPGLMFLLIDAWFFRLLLLLIFG